MTAFGIRKEEIDAWTTQALAQCNITALPHVALEALLREEISSHAWLFRGSESSRADDIVPQQAPSKKCTPSPAVKAGNNAAAPLKKKKKSSMGTAEKNKRRLKQLMEELARAIEAKPDRVASFVRPRPVLGPLSTDPDKEKRENDNRKLRYALTKEEIQWHRDFLDHLNGGPVTCNNNNKREGGGDGENGCGKAARRKVH
jgi:hypothetical protein